MKSTPRVTQGRSNDRTGQMSNPVADLEWHNPMMISTSSTHRPLDCPHCDRQVTVRRAREIDPTTNGASCHPSLESGPFLHLTALLVAQFRSSWGDYFPGGYLNHFQQPGASYRVLEQ